jgi:hypothetical protein
MTRAGCIVGLGPGQRSREPSCPAITEITFCAWLAQAEPGATLVYYRGFLAVDTDTPLVGLTQEERRALRQLRDAAFRAAEQGLVHLAQARLATDRFAYLAIARPRQEGAPVSLSQRLLDAQAA